MNFNGASINFVTNGALLYGRGAPSYSYDGRETVDESKTGGRLEIGGREVHAIRESNWLTLGGGLAFGEDEKGGTNGILGF